MSLSELARALLEPGLRLLLLLALTLAGQRLVVSVGQRVLTRFILRTLRGMDQDTARKRADTLAQALARTSSIVILLLGGLMALGELGVNLAPLLAAVGVGGIALGLGAQALIRDLISGFFILVENQFGVGDVISAAGRAGLVESVNLRRTVLRDLDGTVHSIPNGEITVVSNLTREWSRVNLNVPVSYETDVNHAIAVLNRIGRELAEDPAFAPLIVEPPQVLRVDALEDSGYALKILGVTRPIRQWDVMGELRKRILQVFPQEGIEIPYPHRVLLSKGEPPLTQPPRSQQ